MVWKGAAVTQPEGEFICTLSNLPSLTVEAPSVRVGRRSLGGINDKIL